MGVISSVACAPIASTPGSRPEVPAAHWLWAQLLELSKGNGLREGRGPRLASA